MTQNEFLELSDSVKWARRYGLFVEFWTFYRRYRESGDSVSVACGYALWDWDL